MKRSEINRHIREAEELFHKNRFFLPPWSSWKPEDWKSRLPLCGELLKSRLGWDLTDFGSGSFLHRGLLLVTIRNGNDSLDRKPYAEKIMVVRENQETPWHFHWKKTEDIINRGGGELVIQLNNSGSDGSFSETPVTVLCDGLLHEIPAGGSISLNSGESITLQQGVYHRFFAREGMGTVMAGEVSMTNDDTTDNWFHESCGRFPAIQEDEPPYRLLVGDYENLLEGKSGKTGF